MQLRNRSKMRWGSRMMTAMMAMILCMAMSLSALAGDEGTVNTPASAEFTKYLEYAGVPNLSHPGVKFTFTFAPISKDGVSTQEVTDSMPKISDAYIEFTGRETATPNDNNGMMQVSAKSGNVVESNNVSPAWFATGVYEYRVTETANTYTGTHAESMTYSQATYTLYVVVSYDIASKQYYIKETYIDQTKTNDGTIPGGGKGGTNPDDTSYNFIFTNTYSKQGGSPAGSKALTISKTTTGTGSDPTKQFEFTITANDSVTGSTTRGIYSGTISRVPGSTEPTTFTLTADGREQSFTLADGENIIFDKLPIGTTFTVVETGVSGYTPSFLATTNAGSITSPTTEVGANLSTGSQTIAALSNEVNFTNTYAITVPGGGILANAAPFAALIAIAILAFVVFAALNRRKASR